MIFEAHEIHPKADIGWTIPDDPNDWDEENSRRHVRNLIIKKQLLGGKTVQYTSSGNSLWPWVHSGDCCLIEPCRDASDHKLDDI